MAAIQLDPKSKRYRIRFRFDGQEYKRSIKTKSEREARSILGRVDETIALIERGRLEMPEDVDPGKFILSDGRRNCSSKKDFVKSGGIRTLGQLFDRYETSGSEGVKETTTLSTEGIHLAHLRRLLKTSQQLTTVTVADLQQYVDKRLKEKHGDRLISPDTAKKELATLRVAWNWAVDQEFVKANPPRKGIRYPKQDEKPPFMTWAEIERRVARGGISDDAQSELWAALFLTKVEIQASLDHVKEFQHRDFIFPMMVFTAHTGARRSELLRSQIDDFDFLSRNVCLREKKRSRSKAITFRHVPMTDLLATTMQNWFSCHPGGQFTLVKGRNQPLKPYDAQHYFEQVFKGSRWHRLKGFHVFRHSFASNLAAGNVDQRVIDEWMGHQTDEMRRRYRHLFPDQQRAAIDAVFGRKAG